VPPDFNAFITRLGDRTSTRITIIQEVDAQGRRGRVLADSWENPDRLEPHDRRPEVRQARETGERGVATRRSRSVDTEMLYLALPVYDDHGARLLGFVRTSLPDTLVRERRASVRTNVILGAAGAALCGLVLALVVTRRLTTRLARMARAARDITEGREPGPLPTESTDETGDLARDLQKLAGQLERRLDVIEGERNRLTAVLGSMMEGVVAVDRSEQVLHLNVVAADLLRASPTESVGRRIWEVTRVHQICETLEKVLETDAEVVREIRLEEGGPRRVLEAYASPLRDGQGELRGAVVVLHDITELLRLETVRRDFVANVSHELKTPLTAIRGLLETLLDDGAMDAETRSRFLGKAHDQSLRLTTLVKDLLALSRIESEETAVEHRRMDLCRPLREAIRRLDPGLQGRALTVDVSLPDEPVHVFGDEEAIRQIADNLLDNALKYTPDGGRVGIRVASESDGIVFEVEDSGIGIASHHLDRIFERFYRVDKARSRELGGTGLGLSIVKHLVEALHGSVSVKSEVGRGTAFRVVLPAASSPA
jgi:two-component system phosphate regulon sensor histidine kinase PhoR